MGLVEENEAKVGHVQGRGTVTSVKGRLAVSHIPQNERGGHRTVRFGKKRDFFKAFSLPRGWGG
jgi:hypothetical protein